jgi:ABC-type taurine transport system substrate-binding protein
MSLIGSSPIAGQQLRGQQIELIGMMDLIGDAERLVVKVRGVVRERK